MNERHRIGSSRVMAPGLGLGTNKVGGLYPGVTDEDGRSLLREALDRGIGYLDTAYGYGWGRSEEIIGQVLRGHDRSKVVLATKAGPYQGADATTADAGGGRARSGRSASPTSPSTSSRRPIATVRWTSSRTSTPWPTATPNAPCSATCASTASPSPPTSRSPRAC